MKTENFIDQMAQNGWDYRNQKEEVDQAVAELNQMHDVVEIRAWISEGGNKLFRWQIGAFRVDEIAGRTG